MSLPHCFFTLDIARDIFFSAIYKSTTLTTVRGVNLPSHSIMRATARTPQGQNNALLYVLRACLLVGLSLRDPIGERMME